jgi:hypothetical protein
MILTSIKNCYKKSLFPCGKRQNKLLDDFFHYQFLFQSRRIKLKGLNLLFYTTKQLMCQGEKNIQKNFRLKKITDINGQSGEKIWM